MPVFAATAVPPFLVEAVALVVAAALVAYVCQRIGLVPIVGFLLAGVAIGPHALALVRDEATIEAVAELGVLLLLFTIGIEFSLDKLQKIRRLIFVGGGAQVLLATGAVAGTLLTLGVDWRAAVFSGFLAALSSTAIVLKVLGDRGETGTPAGQTTVALLIFQDVAVIVMVLLVPALGGGSGGEAVSGLGVAWALAKAALVIVAALVVARRLMPPLLEAVARTCAPELFLLTVIAACFGTALLVGLAGVSLSLGAFLAGLVVSQSRFAQHALSEILPLQILFSAAFFVSVGLLLDLGFVVQNPLLVLAVIVGVFVLKLVTTGAAARLVGQPAPVAAASALVLAQVGEFSFVLERAGREVGLSPLGLGEAGSQAFVAATVTLMALTPLLAPFAGRLSRRMEAQAAARAAQPEPDEADVRSEAFEHLEHHVVVAGYGDAARKLVRVLQGAGIPFVIATLSPEGATEAEADGLPVLRGDYTRRPILDAVGLDRAKLLVVADDGPAMAHRVASVARALSPTTRVVALTDRHRDAEELVSAGADRVIAADHEAVVGLFDDVLRHYGVAPEEILRHEEALRRRGYAALDGAAAALPPVACEIDGACLAQRTVTVRPGTPAVGLAVGALAEGGLDVRALSGDGAAGGPPDPDHVLRAGDVLTLAGPAQAFATAADLFRPAGGDGAPAPPPATSSAMRTVVDTEALVTFTPDPSAGCAHTDRVHPVKPSAPGCEECLKAGQRWVHLRVCMTCGHVGCCDSSPGKHATAHFHESAHPVMRSVEPGEAWGWCYVDEVML